MFLAKCLMIGVQTMPNTREKLIELIQTAKSKKQYDFLFGNIDDAIDMKSDDEYIADHLIANGVTVQKWIPVTERLPEENERVLVYHDDGVIRFGINKCGFADVVSTLYLQNHHRTCFSKVTHWMPLPEPPKGE